MAEIRGTFITLWRNEKCYQKLFINLNGRGKLGDLDMDGRMMRNAL